MDQRVSHWWVVYWTGVLLHKKEDVDARLEWSCEGGVGPEL